MTNNVQQTQTATLFFDLTSVDGEDAFRTAIDGWKYKHVLSNIVKNLTPKVASVTFSR